MFKGMTIYNKGFYMKKVKDLLNNSRLSESHFISSESLLSHALKKVMTSLSNTLFVTEDNAIIGVFSFKDLVRDDLYDLSRWNTYKVKDVMKNFIPSIHSEASINECLNLMRLSDFSCLAVKEKNRIIGFIDSDYLIEQAIEEKDFIIDQMRTYINGGLATNFEVEFGEFYEYQNVELPILITEEFAYKAA